MRPADPVPLPRTPVNRRQVPAGRIALGLFLLALAGAAAAAPAADAPPVNTAIRGLPLTRFYPFEEIGDVSRGARLSFDEFGRLAVIQNGAYVVLNDATWIDLADHRNSDAAMLSLVPAADGQWYYGALGRWGVAQRTREGRLRAHSIVPPGCPKWVATTNFWEVTATRSGVYFAGWNGVVYYDTTRRRHTFIAVPQLAHMFRIGDRVFASVHNAELEFINAAAGVAQPVPGTSLDGAAVDQAAKLDDQHVLLSTFDGRLFTFDGERAVPWSVQLASETNRVSALGRLVDGGLVVAVNGRGLYLVSPAGQVLSAMTSPEFQRVTDVANREPGVLWVAAETGVEKVLYGSPVTVFGQRLGLPISWPQVVSWHDRIIVASGGRMYEATPGAAGGPTRFHLMDGQPSTNVWAIAAHGPHLLVGNSHGVFAMGEHGFTPVLTGFDAARLIMVSDELCYVIGMPEIAVLRWQGGRWVECAPRVAGVGYPSVAHATDTAAWIELGPNRVARIVLHGDHLVTRIFEDFPWTGAYWVNVGIIGDTVVLSGPDNHRLFFDEKREVLCDAPELQRRLAHAPFPIARIRADGHGTWWATHERGLFTMTAVDDKDRFDTDTFDILDDHTPLLHLLPNGDVWLSSGQSLYHVDHRSGTNLPHSFSPVVVSVTDGRTNGELAHGPVLLDTLHRLTFSHNNLSFRFFAGSYAYRRPPAYEYRLKGRGGNWTLLGNGSVLNFPDLREGKYQLEVALANSRGALGPVTTVDFGIQPPWYRAWYSYAGYAIALALAVWALLRWYVHRTRARNVELEQLVARRTDELKAAMRKLNEETRHAATLAERNRLAGEVHDSLQQGLSGLMLNLDSTLKLPGVTGDVRSRLNVARKMVSFTRHEVQHAVWGLESPLLEGSELGDALQRMTSLISAGAAEMQVTVTGPAAPLSSAAKHHLLRIAQEAITNAVRHSAAQRIDIRLEYRAGAVTLTVADDGRGFNPDDVLANGIDHFGLRGLRSRAAAIAGALSIHSVPAAGTTISITVQLTNGTASPPHAVNGTA